MSIVVMTGGTSGLGAIAAQRLASTSAQIFLAARSQSGQSGITTDLTRLDSTRAFAAQVIETIGTVPIDLLILNAGGYGDGRTPEGYDATFVLNYLSHYLLVRLLWSRLAEGARIILTTSGTHDPANHSAAPAPHHANADWLAHPELNPKRDAKPRTQAMRTYASAKLCMLLLARYLAARTDAQSRNLQIMAYDPGPTPGTGLARGQSLVLRLLWGPLAALLRRALPGSNTKTAAGEALTHLAQGEIVPPSGRLYAALRAGVLTWPDPSILARRDDLAAELWAASARLAGLSPD